MPRQALGARLPAGRRARSAADRRGPRRPLRPCRAFTRDGLFDGRDRSARRSPLSAARALVRRRASRLIDDPYRFRPVLGDLDACLLGEGTHLRPYDKLGAHADVMRRRRRRRASRSGRPMRGGSAWSATSTSGTAGATRCACAANAASGSCSCPAPAAGAHYKFEIVGRDGQLLPLKADPFALAAELRPATASIVATMPPAAAPAPAPRARANALRRADVDLRGPSRLVAAQGRRRRPLADWRSRRAAAALCARSRLHPCRIAARQRTSVRRLVGLPADRPVRADRRFGTPAGFARFVDACHAAGLGVLLDWVPGAFPDRPARPGAVSTARALYEHADPREGLHLDWNTLIYNFGRTEVRNFLVGNALFWLERYGVDGLRVDAVASMLYLDYSRKAGDWIPNKHGGRENLEAIAFLRRFKRGVRRRRPQATTLAEESTAWPQVSRPV